ncbi:hypothetical protein L6452_35653 [Arctium lappa]|uniref:Uncharacterized protein n=1 Tax=Arctium lappa TaxID=4217 RepID=A0ACB8Y7R2_ARCLA|nr:hypothetical protein L6452_35653 [Arctium lappa]
MAATTIGVSSIQTRQTPTSSLFFVLSAYFVVLLLIFSLPNLLKPKCNQQKEGMECGYYVIKQIFQYAMYEQYHSPHKDKRSMN